MQPDFYLDKVAQAAYVEKDWFDWIIRSGTARPGRFAFAPYDLDLLRSSDQEDFAKMIGVTQNERPPRRMLEIGSSTGRLFYELCRMFPTVEHATLVEPSRNLRDVFDKIFGRMTPAETHPYVPTLRGNGEVLEVRMDTSEARAATSAVDVRTFDLPFADLPTDLGTFDLVACANVIDQCHHPLALIDLLKRSTAPGGLVAISCTYQWQSKYRGLPTDPIRHLDQLFDDKWRLVGEADLPFRVRTNERHWMTFLSHACLFQKTT